MATEFSPIITSQGRGGGSFSLQQLDLHQWGERASPVEVLDHFRVSGRPFPPHPHAGFSAVTYVFEDSQASLRSRDSLGNDAVVGPGGLVWTQAGSGLMHEETPAEKGRELHGLQIFVNLSSKNKLVKPQQFRIENQGVPAWRSNAGDRVRVVVGSFAELSSRWFRPKRSASLMRNSCARSLSSWRTGTMRSFMCSRAGQRLALTATMSLWRRNRQ